MFTDLRGFNSIFFVELKAFWQEIGHILWNQVFMMSFQLVSFTQHTLFDLGLWACDKKVFLEEHVMDHESKCPDINLRSILFLSKNLGWHEDGCAYNFVVNLFLNRKTEVTQLVEYIGAFLLQEYIVRLDISVNDIIFRNEFYSASKLVHDLNGFRLRKSSSFVNDLLQITIGTKLQDHGDVVLCQKTIVNLGSKHSVRISAKGKLPQNTHLAIYNKEWIYWWFPLFYCRTS